MEIDEQVIKPKKLLQKNYQKIPNGAQYSAGGSTGTSSPQNEESKVMDHDKMAAVSVAQSDATMNSGSSIPKVPVREPKSHSRHA